MHLILININNGGIQGLVFVVVCFLINIKNGFNQKGPIRMCAGKLSLLICIYAKLSYNKGHKS